jgi:WD40 repeat protein
VLWEAATGQQVPVNLTGLFGEVKSLTFSEDGQLLAAGSDEGKVRLWGVENRELLDIELASVPGPIVSLTFVGDDVLMGIIAEGGTFRWDLSTGEISASTSIPADDKRYSSYLGPQGKIAATGDTEGQIQLIDLDSGGLITDPLHHIVPFQGNLFSIAPSPDGAILATASADGTVILWDRASGQPIMAPLLGHSSLVVSLAFSPNGRYVASGSCSVFHAAGNCIGGQVIVWDASTGEAVHVLEDAVGFSQAVSFSPDSTLLTVNDCELVEVAGACLEGSIRLYDISTGQTVAVYSGHDSFIWSAAFSPDGRLLATGSQDNTIIIWDLVTGQPVGQRLENHGGPVRRVSFSPDGHLLASAGFDNIVILWDVSSGQAIGGPLAVYTNNAMDVVFSADGRYLVSSSLDGMINVEDVDLNSWRQRACHIANRNLRPEEWDQFFGDLPYRDTCSGR